MLELHELLTLATVHLSDIVHRREKLTDESVKRRFSDYHVSRDAARAFKKIAARYQLYALHKAEGP